MTFEDLIGQVESGPERPGAAKHILVIDTDPGVRWSLEKGLAHSGYIVRTASTVDQALRIVHEEPVSGILMELVPEAGLTVGVLASLVKAPASPAVVCSSIDSAPNTVIECMRNGAAGFLLKPFSLAEVRAALAAVLASGPRDLLADETTEEGREHGASLLVGVSPPMQELRAVIKQVAQTDLNCLIRGESGVGKDIVAREIHRLSPRRDQPFIKVNCSALPEQLLESELFGFEKGAFTGATDAKLGRFSLADKGIIFLDEICEVHPHVQAKLLQVIEHKEFTKLGGRRPVKVDAQIVAATNANIEERTKDGTFRQDLFFRLNEMCLWLPPLSQRREDVPLLVRHFVQKYHHFTGGRPLDITGEDLSALCQRDWPGNVRELESTIKRWLVLGKRDGDLRPSLTPPEPSSSPPAEPSSPEPPPERILKALEECQWNRRKAAETLGISYQVLRRRIDKYELDQRR